MTLSLAPTLLSPYLSDDDALMLSYLLSRIAAKRDRNRLLSDYYDGKRQVQGLGVAISPEFDHLETVVGWPRTVVDTLNSRRSIDHIDVPDSSDQTDILEAVWSNNDMDTESAMLADDQSIHGISFTVVAQSPEGDTIILPTPATRMTCEYERAQRRITAAASDDRIPSAYYVLGYSQKWQATLYLPDNTYVVEVLGGKYKILHQYANPVGIVPVQRFVNRPRHDRPWGNSEITPAVISYTNAAVRTLVSMEVSREFFAAPQRYALNIDPDAFTDSKTGEVVKAWETYWGRFISLTASQAEDGTLATPTLGQLPASSPAPLVELMKMLSQMLASEATMPPSYLGFVTENPPSGDGARMYENGQVLKAKARNRADTAPWSRTLRLALLAEGVPEADLPAEVQIIWSDPATHTPASTTDAVTKQIASGALPAESDVALEQFGYDRLTVERVQQDRRKAKAQGLVAGLAQIASANANPPATQPATDPATGQPTATPGPAMGKPGPSAPSGPVIVPAHTRGMPTRPGG